MKKTNLCIKNFCFAVCVNLFTCNIVVAQQNNIDSAIVEKAKSTNLFAYKVIIQENLRLYNAPRYSFTAKRSYGTPFWDTDSLIIGRINYDGTFYKNVPLKYDLVNQQVVTTNFDNSALTMLASEKVQQFKINNHQFFWIDNKTGQFENLGVTGFYDRLYFGKVLVWSKRSKELRLSNNAEEQSGRFRSFDRFYIQKDSAFFEVKDRRQLIDILKDNKNAVKEFIGKSQLDFNKNFEQSLIEVAAYYDQLKN